MNQPNPPPRDFASSSSMTVHTLPEGTRLHDFEICGLIGEGGFGIVYLAQDHSLGRRVAIKEYMPASMASRAHASSAVVIKSQRHEETFRLGLRSFVNEARLLARFDHPALVKVYRFWEENGTAYMVMPYYQGPTLKAALTALGRPPTETELRNWLRPLLDALSVMHVAQCFHRDIAPDNILLTTTGPLLLDFGAARHVIADMTHALTVVLKPGYAPIEQYGEVPSLTQGAWTDLYALASVVYTAICGKAPMSAVERLMDDRHVPLAQLPQTAAGQFSESFVSAIDAALQVRPRDRPQDVAAFRLLLDGAAALGEVRSPLDFVSTFGSLHDPLQDSSSGHGSLHDEVTVPPPTQPDGPGHAPTRPDEVGALREPSPSFAAAQPVARPAVLPPVSAPAAKERPAPPRSVSAPVPNAERRKTQVIVAAGVVGAAVLVGAFWFVAGSRRDQPDLSTLKPAPAVQTPPKAEIAGAAAPTAAKEAPARPVPELQPRAQNSAPTQDALTPPPEPPPLTTKAPAPSTVANPPPRETASPSPQPKAPAIAANPTSLPPARSAEAPRTPRAAANETSSQQPPAESTPPKNAALTRAKCSDILQKASLEPLTASEAAFLRRECQ